MKSLKHQALKGVRREEDKADEDDNECMLQKWANLVVSERVEGKCVCVCVCVRACVRACCGRVFTY